MNRFNEIRKEQDRTIEDIANTLGVDEATLFLLELTAGYIHIDLALSLCSLLDVSLFEMFPDLADLASAESDEEDEEIAHVFDMMCNPEHRVRFFAVGIDPDTRNWYVAFRFRSGVERRYQVSSVEKSYIEDAITSEDKTNPFIVFHGDCRTIIVRRDAILDARFSNNMSYAPFRTSEQAFTATLVLENMIVPRTVILPFDDPSEGGHGRPLGDLISKAREGSPIPAYLRYPEENGECLLNIERMEAMEIPVGLTIPFLYLDEVDLDDLEFEGNELSMMEPQGTA